jgi:hypothetical protein
MTATPDVVNQVLVLANDVHGAARDAGREDVRAPLAEQAGRWHDATSTIVVAGAQKRGKSRLLNTLVGRPDLLPVDADIATGTQIVLRHGEKLRVTVHRGVAGSDPTEIDPADLADHASALGDPAKRRGVTLVDVTLDDPLLDGVTLVDTPGVDSLTLGHRHATMAALARADALLFAVSAQDQPILRHELEFLVEAADRIHAVAFVLTKVEDSSSWRELLGENRDRLARFVERLDEPVARRLLEAPWFPVSAKLGEAAARQTAAGRAERAETLLARSGMPALRGYVRRSADRRELVRAGGVLALTASALRALDTVEQDRVIGGGTDLAAVEQRLAGVDAALVALADAKRDRRRRSIDHHLLGRRVTNRARARLESYRRTYEREIAELATPAAVEAYARGLSDSVDRTLTAAWTEISADTEQAAGEAILAYLAEMGVESAELDRAVLDPPTRIVSRIVADAPPGKFDLIGEGVPAAMMVGGVGFMSHNALVGAGLAFGFGAVAVPIVLGGLLATTLLAHRRKVAEAARNRAALTKALGDGFTVAANEMCLAAEQAVAVWRGTAEQAVDTAFAARHEELTGRRRELGALAAKGAAEKQREAAEATERLATLHSYGERATKLAAELTGALADAARSS